MSIKLTQDTYFVASGSSATATTWPRNAGVMVTLPTVDSGNVSMEMIVSGDNVATQIIFGASSVTPFNQFAGYIVPGNGTYLVPTGLAAETSSQASVASNGGSSTVVFQRGSLVLGGGGGGGGGGVSIGTSSGTARDAALAIAAETAALNAANAASASVTARLQFRGAFAAGAYAANDAVVYNGVFWTAPTAFTATSTFNPSNWTALSSAPIVPAAFSSGTAQTLTFSSVVPTFLKTTLTGNTVFTLAGLTAPSQIPVQSMTIEMVQDGTGGRVPSFTGATIISLGGTIPTAAGATCLVNLISLDGSNVLMSVTGGGAPSGLPVSNTYTTSGTLAVGDVLSLVNSSSTCNMTLAAGAYDGQPHHIKRYGSGTVTVTANIDGTAGAVLTANSSTIKEMLHLNWDAALSTWLVAA